MRTDFADRFEAQLPSIEQAIAQMPGDESAQVPGLAKPDLVIFCRSFRPLLRKVDGARAIDRTLLAYGASSVPEQVLATFTNAASQAPNGIDHFLQNYLGTLIDLRNRLEAATGSTADESVTGVALKRRLQAADRLFEELAGRLDTLAQERSKLEAQMAQLSESATTFETQKYELESLVEEVTSLRDQAKGLVDGGAEGESSVGELYKSLSDVATKAAARLVKIDEALSTARNSANSADQAKAATNEIQANARAALEDAKRALRGSTQAGLAESFITERDNKLRGLLLYGAALTIALIGASIFAVTEVIPAVSDFTQAIATGNNNIGALAISLSIRTILLAPFVFLAWFAAVQYRRIDLLRIDYAAKAAVAKAYVGYKDEVKGDPKLLAALKHFLIQRFGEHPVRLVTNDSSDDIPLHVFGIGSGYDAPAAGKGKKGRGGNASQA